MHRTTQSDEPWCLIDEWPAFLHELLFLTMSCQIQPGKNKEDVVQRINRYLCKQKTHVGKN
jgi:hypothetical protein